MPVLWACPERYQIRKDGDREILSACVAHNPDTHRQCARQHHTKFGILLIIFSCAWIPSWSAATLSARFLPDPQIPDVPFHLYQGYLVMVEGRIGNLDHQNLSIDTGTSPSMVDESIARKAGPEWEQRRNSLFNKNVPAERVVLR